MSVRVKSTSGTYNVQETEQAVNQQRVSSHSTLQCTVHLLDDSQQTFSLDVGTVTAHSYLFIYFYLSIFLILLFLLAILYCSYFSLVQLNSTVLFLSKCRKQYKYKSFVQTLNQNYTCKFQMWLCTCTVEICNCKVQ